MKRNILNITLALLLSQMALAQSETNSLGLKARAHARDSISKQSDVFLSDKRERSLKNERTSLLESLPSRSDQSVLSLERKRELTEKPNDQQKSLGNEGGGGGDICENRIKTIAADISSWIALGGHRSLQLDEVSPDTYQASMLEQISGAQVQCVSQGDEGYPVQIGNVPKTCVWSKTTFQSTITCDLSKFQALSESDQYVLIHHEYAGLAGIETPNGTDSHYQVSNQISSYLVNQVVKKLAVKSVGPGSWRTLEGAEGSRVMNGLYDILKKSRFSDCDIDWKIYYADIQYTNPVIRECQGERFPLTTVEIRSKANPENVYSSLNIEIDCNKSADFQTPGYHLLLKDDGSVVLRHWADHTFENGDRSSNALFTLDPSETKISKIEVSVTRRDHGTFIHPITNGQDIPAYSFTCTPIH